MSGVISVGELRGIITLSDQFSGPIDKVAKALGVSSESFGAMTAAAGLAVGAITAATAAVVALGTRGAEVADVRAAFDGFSQSAGESADVMLGKLQEGTLGTISNFELMKLANKALGAGLIKSSDDMGTLARGAQLLADRTGGDTKEAFETLTSTIASGRTAQLKQLGLFVDSKVAVSDYAASLGKSVGDLTDAERAQGLSQATLAKLNEELDKGAKAQADFGDNVQKVKVFFQNFTDSLGEAIATSPVVAAGMDGIGKALQAAFGGEQQDTVKALMGWINEFAIFLVKTGQVGVEVARFLMDSWNGLKVLFNTVLAAITDGLGFVQRAVANVLEAIADLPGAPEWLKDMAKGARSAADELQLMSASFKQQSEEALDNAARNNAALDTVQAALGETVASMEAARNETALTTKAVTALGEEHEKTAARSVESSQKIAETHRQLQQEIALAQTEGIEARLLELQFDRENQIAGLRELKDLSKAEYDLMVADVNEKYDLMAAKVRDDYAVQVKQAFLDLENEIALAQTTGIENRMLQIDIAQAAELEKLRTFTLGYGMLYEALASLVRVKYEQMRAAAEISQAGIVQAANDAGFQTRAQLEETADRAKRLFEEMTRSGKFNADELQKAWEAYIKAKDKLTGDSTLSTQQKFELLAQSATSIIRSIFGKSKAAAIAAAIIDTAAAVAKALSAYPWPFSLGPAAAALAAGLAQVNTIRNTDYSARTGTPGTAFEDFGRESIVALHNEEAIVTRAQGQTLAGLVEAAAERGGGRQAPILSPHFLIQIGPQEVRDFHVREVREGFMPGL